VLTLLATGFRRTKPRHLLVRIPVEVVGLLHVRRSTTVCLECRFCYLVSAWLSRRSRRHLRQSPAVTARGSTHVDTAFIGLTSSGGVTVDWELSERSSSLQPWTNGGRRVRQLHAGSSA
jgi:hypothetical protein